ncbi:MAG TPA: hypothetical protein VFC79_01155 [Tissierellaceae bacterium]|nr:hypothetical protein [Tissierellaceae bacterium]
MRSFEEGAFEHFVNKLKDNLGLKADKTYVDNKVKTDVPEGAEFTDTITMINGKTGLILKDDIVALGILAQGTTLRLGNFKFVFNEVENSLDLEVLA